MTGASQWLLPMPCSIAASAGSPYRRAHNRFPIVLPQQEDIELVMSRCPPIIASAMRVAIVTGGARNELVNRKREHVDHKRKQMMLIGKGRRGAKKTRVIDLEPSAVMSW
jgi:integrase